MQADNPTEAKQENPLVFLTRKAFALMDAEQIAIVREMIRTGNYPNGHRSAYLIGHEMMATAIMQHSTHGEDNEDVAVKIYANALLTCSGQEEAFDVPEEYKPPE